MSDSRTPSHLALPRLLLVDTQAGFRFTIGDYFRRLGVAVDEAASISEAEAWLAKGAYGVVLTDLQLSARHEGEGIALARRVRSAAPTTAVCILTVPSEPRLMQAAASVANVVLTRPRKLADIAQVVFALLHDPAATAFTSTGAYS
ncbi:MAG: response regulator [Gemmatimonadota bacterium]